MAGRPIADLFVNVRPDMSGFPRALQAEARRLKPLEVKVKPVLDRSAMNSLSRGLSAVFSGKGGGLTGSGGLAGFGLTMAGAFTAAKVAAVGLSPVLVSLGGSAVVASTSLAAIGPAAIAAGTAFAGLKAAFGDTTEAFKLFQKRLDSDKAMEKWKEKYAALSKTGQGFVDQLIVMDGQWDKFTRKMEKAALPGFTKLLKDINTRPKNGKSIFDIFEKGAERFGKTTSKNVGQLGELLKDKEIKNGFSAILKDGNEAFDSLGKSMLVLVRPFMRIFKGSSPLLKTFSGYIEDISTRFAQWVGTFSDSEIKDFFKDSGTELSKWWKIVRNAGTIFKNLFWSSAPSGGTMVDAIGDVTQMVADWTSNSANQKKMQDFFQKIVDAVTDFDYVAFGKMVAGVASISGALKIASALSNTNPLMLLLGALAVSYPAETADVLGGVAAALGPIIGFAADHPAAVTSMIGLFAAMKGLNAIRGLDLSKLIPSLGDGKNALQNVSLNGTMQGATAGNPLWVTLTVPSKRKVPTGGAKPKGGTGAGGVAGGIAIGAGMILMPDGTIKATPKGVYERYIPRDQVYQRPPTVDNRYHRPPTTSPGPAPGPVGKWDPNTGRVNWGQPMGQGYKPKGDPVGDILKKTWKTIDDWFTGPWRDFWVKRVNDERNSIPGSSVGAGAVPSGSGGAAGAVGRLIGILGKLPVALENSTSAFGGLDDVVAGFNTTTADSTRLQGLNRSALALTLGQVDENKTGVNQYKGAIDLIPGIVDTLVRTPGAPAAKTLLYNVANEANRVDGTFVANLSTSGYADVENKLRGLLVAQGALKKGTTLASAAKGVGSILAAATGGYIRGPGGPTADKIPAMLSDTEYVHKAAAVKKYGVDFMHAINEGEIPVEITRGMGFAKGGLVNMPYPTNVKGTQIPAAMFGGGAGGGSSASMVNTLHGAGFGFDVYSGLRNSRTLSGNLSRHALGKAIDITPNRAIANWIYSNAAGNTAELITPWRDRMLWHGKPHKYSAAIERQHGVGSAGNDHIHWSVYDQGGMLPSGKAAINMSGRPERVLNPAQTRDYDRGYMRIDPDQLLMLAEASSGGGDIHWYGDMNSNVEGEMFLQRASIAARGAGG